MNNNESSKGIQNILSVILMLQQNVCCEEGLDTCDRPMLGGSGTCLSCNTRPVMIYTCCSNGTPFSMPTSKDSITNCSGESVTDTCSTVFRVEKIDEDCCTFRVLAPNTDATSLYPYVATNSFFTMDCGCICAVRCLSDTYVDCVC